MDDSEGIPEQPETTLIDIIYPEEGLMCFLIRLYLMLGSAGGIVFLAYALLVVKAYYGTFEKEVFLLILYLFFTLFGCLKRMSLKGFIILGLVLNLPLLAYIAYLSLQSKGFFLWHGIYLSFPFSWLALFVSRLIEKRKMPVIWKIVFALSYFGIGIGGLYTLQAMPPSRVPPDVSLTEAASNGNARQVRELLEQGSDVEAKDPAGWTPLMRAAQSHHTTVIQILLDNGANPNVSEDIRGMNALLLAVESKNLSSALVLLNHNANVNTPNRGGYTPLMLAVQSGEVEMVQLLIDRGADITARIGNGETALDVALEFREGFNQHDLEAKTQAANRKHTDHAVVFKDPKANFDKIIQLLKSISAPQ
ncbi:MAG: ankyrin repeat domain-containing protein [Acidobacteria bacterium]|nr:ankyrin repeat domain-containing protein [Acidobacteriota bacterium]